MRGEYEILGMTTGVIMELPPHARRIHFFALQHGVGDGTTSACAENTVVLGGGCFSFGNYLRMRGEYCADCRHTRVPGELPPHARRILTQSTPVKRAAGTTSACAENTVFRVRNASTTGNYLRMRGEYGGYSV